MRFPKIVENRKTKVQVVIYGKSKGGKPMKDGRISQP